MKYQCLYQYASVFLQYLRDTVDVAVSQQLFLQGAEQLVEVGGLAAV